MKLKVSFIEFLNSVPLGWDFVHGEHQGVFDVLFDVPSECARHLAEGSVDVGLIPVIEYQKIEGLKVLPGISISSKREVRSVLFVSRVPLEKVRRVAVDSSSRTSLALLKILLGVFHGRQGIEYVSHPPEPQRMLEHYDSALIIGNPALQLPSGSWKIHDMANEWYRFTGLPFVFAFWAVRPGVDLGSQAEFFYISRREGLRHLDEISALYAERLGIPRGEIEKYVRENLDYSLDRTKLRALETFFELAAGQGLIREVKPILFYPYQQASKGGSADASSIRA